MCPGCQRNKTKANIHISHVLDNGPFKRYGQRHGRLVHTVKKTKKQNKTKQQSS